jgi:uncharacterized peroxidase-related enzyme
VSRLPTIDPTLATGAAKQLLERTQAQLGRIPNLHRTMANAPAALDGYLGLHAALFRGRLENALREKLALLIAEVNGCEYCVSAHTFRGGKIGLSQGELAANRRASSADPKTEAALQFARAVTLSRGAVSDEQLARVRAGGWSDEEVAEMVAHVALNTFTNYFNHVARPELDFPRVEGATHA